MVLEVSIHSTRQQAAAAAHIKLIYKADLQFEGYERHDLLHVPRSNSTRNSIQKPKTYLSGTPLPQPNTFLASITPKNLSLLHRYNATV
jgi:hypothetical protein